MGKRATPLSQKGAVTQHKEKWRAKIWLSGQDVVTPSRGTAAEADADLVALRGCASEEAAKAMAQQLFNRVGNHEREKQGMQH